MCSGRVDLSFILEGFRRGADGVLVTGCHIGDCHYLTGNEYARDRMQRVKPLLESLALDPGRFRLEWISASEGKKFSEVVTEFTNTIKELGPLQLQK
jgi:F420-non-reducing hydrogenase iron-sulfur subunit